MAGLSLRVPVKSLLTLNKNVAATATTVRYFFGKEKYLPDPMDLATGVEKRELERIAAGDLDPWNAEPVKRGPGTKDQPNMVPSCNDRRLVSCVCEPDDTYLNWIWVHKDEPRRCSCGYWFKLYYKPPV